MCVWSLLFSHTSHCSLSYVGGLQGLVEDELRALFHETNKTVSRFMHGNALAGPPALGHNNLAHNQGSPHLEHDQLVLNRNFLLVSCRNIGSRKRNKIFGFNKFMSTVNI
jgi:hypothetical protein